MQSTNDYEIINHTADIGIRVKGRSLSEIIEKSILAMTDIMTGKAKLKDCEKRNFEIKEEDKEIAFVSILEEILYLFEYYHFAANNCKTSIENNTYSIDIIGEILESERIRDSTEIKAVTYHNLEIEKKKEDEWCATVIFDI